MLEQVEKKIQDLKDLRAKEYYKKKDEDLKAWGLTTKADGKKITPIIVTDDEYEQLVKAANGIGKTGRNSVANILHACAWLVFVIGAVAGSVAAALSEDYAVIAFTASIIIGAIFALIFMGLTEVIRLLQQLIDSKAFEKPEAEAAKKPQVQKAAAKVSAPAPAPMYVPYTSQGQTYAYPVYAAPQTAEGDKQAAPAFNPENLQAYYQQPVIEPPIADEIFNGR